ncbi:MAG: Crp/Fnr family transcriptional regulator [Gammaproteobacteria bacterium]|nr:Crp/Fnr family transcriptional regulator [Gammaproteobacteria bacterium]MAY02591.1 Crp/Fnr family transcriptional regulator [Gammaproteobacteria bacterium]|tara:strand:+ start:5158 stop:5901 length:744 start_codon:yes stop_codon:yes gene_type:complete
MSNPVLNTATCNHGFIEASCTNCNLKGLCLPLAMDIKDIDRLDSIIQRSRPIQGGEHLYRAGEKFTSIYAVRSGSIKTYLIDDDGIEQITGFYLPGEILGFDGIDTNEYGCNVVALDTSTVCEIPFHRLEELSLQIPTLQRHFFQLMSRQIENNHQMLLTLSKKNAEGRVATLLISLSQRYSRRKLSPNAMRLPMSRMDIGNFLGLTIETVSRTFSRLQKEKIIEVDGREVLIIDHDRLNEICHKTR